MSGSVTVTTVPAVLTATSTITASVAGSTMSAPLTILASGLDSLSAWPKFHGSNWNSGLASSLGHVPWTFVGSGGATGIPPFSSSPAIDASGNAYVGCWDSNVYAVSAAGKILWNFTTGGPVSSSPALSGDGYVYVGSDDGHLYCLNASTGAEVWAYAAKGAINGSAAVGADGNVAVGSYDGKLYLFAIRPSGTQQYFLPNKLTIGSPLSSSPAVDGLGDLVIGTDSSGLQLITIGGG